MRWIPLPVGKRVRAYKACAHETWLAHCNQNLIQVRTGATTYANSNPWVILRDSNAVPNNDPGLAMAQWARESLLDARAGHYDRWLKCKPSLSTRANLGVFLWELADIKRMFQILPRKHVKGCATWRQLLSWVNSQHLNYNFGWKPFVKDLKNSFLAMSSYESRLKKFISEEGKTLMRRWIDSSTSTWTSTVSIGSGFWQRRIVYERSIKNASTFMFRYDIPDYSEKELYWRGLADSLGLVVSPAQIWAVLPWSFVVDWFYDIGGVLESIQSDWVQPWISHVQACCSAKTKMDIQVFVDNASYGQSYPAARITYESYNRTLGLPNINGNTEDLDADKIRLLASLVGSLIL